MLKQIKLTSKMNDKCLTVSEGQYKSKQGYLIVSKYYGGVKQQFFVVASNQDFIIRSVFNNNVLDVESASSSTYAAILTYKYHGNNNQLWRLKNYEGMKNTYYIQNKKSGKVLQIEGGIDVQGMRIVQNKPYGNLNQLWVMQQI